MGISTLICFKMELDRLIAAAIECFDQVEISDPKFIHTVLMTVTISEELASSFRENPDLLLQEIRTSFENPEVTLEQIVASQALISDRNFRDHQRKAEFFDTLDRDSDSDSAFSDGEDDEIFGQAMVEIIGRRSQYPQLPRPKFLEPRRDLIIDEISLSSIFLSLKLLTPRELFDRSNEFASLSNETLLDLSLRPDGQQYLREIFDIFGQRLSPPEYFMMGKFPAEFWEPCPWWLTYYIDEHLPLELADLLRHYVKLDRVTVQYIQGKINLMGTQDFGGLTLLEDFLYTNYPDFYE